MNDTKYLSLFFKGLWCKSPMMSSKWTASFQKCMHRTKPSPSMPLERLFSWISHEMWVDKYENINTESSYSVSLYELTHLRCWLKAYSSKLQCVTAVVHVGLCESRALNIFLLRERSTFRKHFGTSKPHKHSCISQIRCCHAYCLAPKHALIGFVKSSMFY